MSRYGDYSIFLLGLAPVYFSNQHPSSLVLLFLVLTTAPSFGQSTSPAPFSTVPLVLPVDPVTEDLTYWIALR